MNVWTEDAGRWFGRPVRPFPPRRVCGILPFAAPDSMATIRLSIWDAVRSWDANRGVSGVMTRSPSTVTVREDPPSCTTGMRGSTSGSVT